MIAVLLNSGGLDTLASIRKLQEIDPTLELHSLFIDLGQPNATRAKAAAQAIAANHCLTHKEFVFPEGLTAVEVDAETSKTRTPYLNVLLHILAASYARKLNIGYLVSGADDYLTAEFDKKFAAILAEEGRAPYAVIPLYPMRGIAKDDRIQYILNDPLINQTISCNEAVACGVCVKCAERLANGLLAN